MKKMQKEPSGVSMLIGCIFIFMNILLYIREKSFGLEYELLYALGYNFWIICGTFLIVHYQIKIRKFRSNNAKKKNEKKIINHTKSSNLSNERKAIIVGMIGTIIFAGLSVYEILDKRNLKTEMQTQISELKNKSQTLKSENVSLELKLDTILEDKSEFYIKNKLNFLDNNIVFVITGYGNYYSDYDCMLQRVGNSDYTYLAFNKKAAIGHGYQEYKCN